MSDAEATSGSNGFSVLKRGTRNIDMAVAMDSRGRRRGARGERGERRRGEERRTRGVAGKGEGWEGEGGEGEGGEEKE